MNTQISAEAHASGQPSSYVRHLTADPAGARIVLSPASPLVVGVAPVGQVDILLDQSLFEGATAYMLVDWPHAVRVGESLDMPARWADHRAAPPLAADLVVIVAHLGGVYRGRDATLALQAMLDRLARDAGRCDVVGAIPVASTLATTDPAVLARWEMDVRPMLTAAIGPLFERRGDVLQPISRRSSGPPADGSPLRPIGAGYALDVATAVTWPDALHYRLEWRGARASAAAVGDVGVIVEAGALVCAVETASVQPCIARKRSKLLRERILVPTSDPHVLRLTRAVRLPSLTNAARVVTGTNGASADAWRPT
ncbi:hypothetical protein GCM10011322_27470 [Salinarimonas ramus]|uniref:Uncharacterized protein n=2 Tax=Salinarimonas ramus TaxID=690164 RepID=A0A917V558_9HYPH|nr:hypothetical protein GCM10011322_27470 [Salinarimonas ramus]